MTVWRSTPPSPADVRAHTLWWARGSYRGDVVLMLSVNNGIVWLIGSITIKSGDFNLQWGAFDPADWGTELSPCLPPV